MTGKQVMRQPREAVTLLRGGDPLAPALPRAVDKAIQRESAWALVNVARAQAVGFVADARVDAAEMVTERTMLSLDRLNRVEAAMVKADPAVAERFSGLVEDFLLIARTELRNLPREF